MLSQVPRLLEVNLSHNMIHSIDMPLKPGEDNVLFSKHLVNLKVIDLSSNRLTVFPHIAAVRTNLKYLNVSRNNFIELAHEPENPCLKPTDQALEILDMSLNSLKSVRFFERRRSLYGKTKHVDLSHNRIDLEECIEDMDEARLVWGCLSPLSWLTALEVIILSHNQIACIPMEFQHYLPNLRYVDLSHNKIKQIWHGDLLFTRARDTKDIDLFQDKWNPCTVKNEFPGSNNLTIDLRNNSISSLQLPDDKVRVVLPGCDIGSQFSRVKLLLGHNPFVCDCEVFKLLRYSTMEMRPTSALERHNGHMLVLPAVIDIQDLHCSEPDSMNGKAIADVSSWAYHWLPMIGLCWNHLGVQSELRKTSTKPTKVEAMDEPPT
ncbi:chaoptin-like [Ischnura elegans]|uniref:chaoptin-like n=1 Tax=Ischnura elegans TaxID=197161 RepID=UPI001ED8BCC5|nr:chaoptin-like [Ischnura elegans]